MRFEGKVVIVTGVGRRGQSGEAIARAFGEAGASVVVISRTPAEGEARAAELRDAGSEARAFACDLTDHAQVATVTQAIAAAYDARVDALVNAAGGFAMSGPVADSDVGAWHQQFAINLDTAYVATRALLPLLRPAHGAIVYFASAAALAGASVTRMAAYAAAKSGVITLMRAVAQEEREHGVRANAVAPTSIRTAANIETMGENARYVEREEVADAVMYLCSEQASAVTGQVVELQGTREAKGERREAERPRG